MLYNIKCRKKPPFSLVELRAERFPPQSNSIHVDHTTDLRLFAPQRNPQDLSQSAAGLIIAIQLFFGVSWLAALLIAAVTLALFHGGL